MATAVSALDTLEYVRVHQTLPALSPVDPLHVVTVGLTGLWLLVTNGILWRAPFPKQLVLLGFVAALDLFAGFVGALAGNTGLVAVAGLVAGAVAGPLYSLWLGVVLRRYSVPS